MQLWEASGSPQKHTDAFDNQTKCILLTAAGLAPSFLFSSFLSKMALTSLEYNMQY